MMTVNRTKRARLETRGWRLGDAQDFLALTDKELALIGMQQALGLEMKKRRQAHGD
jgi:hypothetical protein